MSKTPTPVPAKQEIIFLLEGYWVRFDTV